MGNSSGGRNRLLKGFRRSDVCQVGHVPWRDVEQFLRGIVVQLHPRAALIRPFCFGFRLVFSFPSGPGTRLLRRKRRKSFTTEPHVFLRSIQRD